jgi:hypothetical protein
MKTSPKFGVGGKLTIDAVGIFACLVGVGGADSQRPRRFCIGVAQVISYPH